MPPPPRATPGPRSANASRDPGPRLFSPIGDDGAGHAEFDYVLQYADGTRRRVPSSIAIWTPEEWEALDEPRPSAIAASNGCRFAIDATPGA